MPIQWNESTLDWICCNSKDIKQVAQILGVPANAIAAIMAKENHLFQHDFRGQQAAEGYARLWLLNLPNAWIYWLAEQLDEAVRTGKVTKVFQPVLLDLGLANFQVATAINLLKTYIRDDAPDPLGFKKYRDDPHLLVDTLTKWLTSSHPATCGMTAQS
jgi:hypothetical protein